MNLNLFDPGTKAARIVLVSRCIYYWVCSWGFIVLFFKLVDYVAELIYAPVLFVELVAMAVAAAVLRRLLLNLAHNENELFFEKLPLFSAVCFLYILNVVGVLTHIVSGALISAPTLEPIVMALAVALSLFFCTRYCAIVLKSAMLRLLASRKAR